MCGVAGLLLSRSEPALPRLRAMCDRLRHRGPDDAGYLLWSGVAGEAPLPLGDHDTPADVMAAGHGSAPQSEAAAALDQPARVLLGHRRLAILDPSPAGHQPLGSPDGRLWIAHNGEVYNHVELREELERCGHVFTSGTDTEVILAAYAEWGAACVERFVGMWAFALLDLERRVAFLARDPFGIKPLYTTRWRGGLAFASEQKALRELPGVGRFVDPAALHTYLLTGATDAGERSMFADIAQLPAGCTLEVSLDAPQVGTPRRYWRLEPVETPSALEPAAAELRRLFLDSVRLHLRSDVPVGACLSGGIDSASIVAAMRRWGGAGLDLRTVTYAADDAMLGEERWARVAAEAAGAAMHVVTADAGGLRREVDALIESQDEPFGSTSIYAQRRVFAGAAEAGLTVMLDGQGADELLAGYWGFVPPRAVGLLGARRPLDALQLLGAAARLPGMPRAWLARATLRELAPRRARRWARRLRGAPAWLDVAWFEARGLGADAPRAVEPEGGLHGHLACALFESSLPALLRYEDRNAMAFSIESRVPFLTPELVSFVLSLPAELLLDGRATTKAVFRRAMQGLTPQPILDRRDKIGFRTPERRWLEQLRPWIDETLASDAAGRVPGLRSEAARAEARAMLGGQMFDARLWRWLNLIRWIELLGIEG